MARWRKAPSAATRRVAAECPPIGNTKAYKKNEKSRSETLPRPFSFRGFRFEISRLTKSRIHISAKLTHSFSYYDNGFMLLVKKYFNCRYLINFENKLEKT